MTPRAEAEAVYSELLRSVPASQRNKHALALAVRVLDLLAEEAMISAQTVLAGGVADAIRGRVPDAIAALVYRRKDGDR